MGTKDNQFGTFIRQNFPADVTDNYWREKFADVEIGTITFNRYFNDYMLWGFDLQKLCEYVCFYDENGNPIYEEFVKRVMDAKLHLQDKNCKDLLKIDQEDEDPYSIYTLLMQFAFRRAENKKVDRYIPLADIRTVLNNAIGDQCDVNGLIDAYIAEESKQEKIDLEKIDAMSEEFDKAVDTDQSEVFTQIMEMNFANIQERQEKYDITEYEDLIAYEKGNVLPAEIKKSLAEVRKFADSIYEEEKDMEIMHQSANEKFSWIVNRTGYALLRDKDWNKMFNDIERNPESFKRYYSIFRINRMQEIVSDMCKALIINDDLYAYTEELVEEFAEEKNS